MTTTSPLHPLHPLTHHPPFTHHHPSGKTGRITVVGPDAQSVQAAREALELFEERHVLKIHQIEYLSRDFSMLEDIKGTFVSLSVFVYDVISL